jgi:hypothetical protein
MGDANKAVGSILTEDVLSLAEARDELASITRRRPDRATLYRWCLRGVGGTKLEFVRLGNVMLTSRQSLHRFLVARTAAKS